MSKTRRHFLKSVGVAAGWAAVPTRLLGSRVDALTVGQGKASSRGAADYTIHIKVSPVEIAPKRIVSTTTYNGQFPGPLLRFKEGRPVTVEIHNDTDTPEQLHWHGQKVSTDVDGASEEGTPFVPAHGQRRITFTPAPSGIRLYHTHNRAGANLAEGSIQRRGGSGVHRAAGRSGLAWSRGVPGAKGV